MVFIDLAVPRDVEVGVGELRDVYRYDLDHLDKMVASNRDLRNEDIVQVEELVGKNVDAFSKRITLAKNPLPAEINQWFESLVEDEFNRLQRKIALPQDDLAETRYAMQRVAAKLRHRSISWLQENPDDLDREHALRELFNLDRGDDS